MNASSSLAAIHPGAADPKRGILALMALLLVTFMSACLLAVGLAQTIDRDEIRHERDDISRAFEAALRSASLTIKDYAFWGEGYRHLHPVVDLDWADARHNLSYGLYQDFGFNGVFVLGPDDRTEYAVIDGKLSEVRAEQWITGNIASVAATARELTQADEQEPVVALMTVAGTPSLIIASPITPGTDESVPLVAGPPSVLIFTIVLDRVALKRIGKQFGYDSLRAGAADGLDTASYELKIGDNSALFTWDVISPGEALLSFLLPVLIVTGLLFALLTALFSRQALASAQQLKTQYQALQASQQALLSSESRFRDVAESSSDWIWEIDADLRITYLSERFQTITGYARQEWIGRPLDALFLSQSNLFDWMHAGEHQYWEVQQREFTVRDGSTRVCRLSARKMAGEGAGYRGTATDITAEVRSLARIEHMAMHDSLTGLANRTAMQMFLEDKLKNVMKLSAPLVMLCVDLDRFKPVNDALGHVVGDQVLKEVSRRLRISVCEGDLVARQGGDEFILLLVAMAGQLEIEVLCKRLIQRVEQPIHAGDTEVFISCSIGISIAPTDSVQPQELLRFADIALYEAKGAGRRTWCFYDKDMNDRIRDRRQLEAELRLALHDQQLRLVFQPRYLSDGKTIAGAEALVRWQHPQRGLLAPDKFIPIAEETGLIVAITDWVLSSACEHASRWGGRFVSVNISALEFVHGDLVARVEQVLANSALPAKLLELELTESVLVEDAANALNIMTRLKALGVCLAIDDFGTGYSSLSYLSEFPFDCLKIDKAFLRQRQALKHEGLFTAIVGVGRSLSMTVIAEGVETQQQLQMLSQAGCHQAQGYYLSRPISPEAMESLLNAVAETLH